MNFSRVKNKIEKLSHEKIAEILLLASNENELFTSIMNSLAEGIVAVDENWKMIFANKAALRLLSFHEDARSQTFSFLDAIDDGEIKNFFSDCEKNKKTNVSDEFTISQNSATRFLSIAVTPFVKQNELHGNLISIRDVTEKRNREIAFRRMEHLAGLTNLAANMAHEIKNPLGAISIHVQLVEKAIAKNTCDFTEKKIVSDHLSVVNEEIENLNKKVVDFLMAVRPVHANFALCNASKILFDTIKFIEPEFLAEKIFLEINILERDVKILVDEKLLKEVFINIAQNALFALKEKFSKPQNETARFSIFSKIKNDLYYISFSDNGIGMTKEELSRIFEPYYTTKASGTGLGMTMAYKIIKEFSGSIESSSEKNVGTQFVISLPLPQTSQKLLTEDTSKKLLQDCEK